MLKINLLIKYIVLISLVSFLTHSYLSLDSPSSDIIRSFNSSYTLSILPELPSKTCENFPVILSSKALISSYTYCSFTRNFNKASQSLILYKVCCLISSIYPSNKTILSVNSVSNFSSQTTTYSWLSLIFPESLSSNL